MSDSSSPPPVVDRPDPPWFVRLLWKTLRAIVITVCTFWLMGSLALHFLAKDSLEQELSRKCDCNVKVGLLRLGLSLEHPMGVASDITFTEKDNTPIASASTAGVGFYTKDFEFKDPPDITFFVGVTGLKVKDKEIGDFDMAFRTPPKLKIDIPEFKGKFRGAKVLASVSKDLNNRWKLNGTIEDLDYSLFAKGLRDGHANVTLDLHGIDQYGVKLQEKMSGRATMVGGEGKLEDGALNFWAGNLLTAFLHSNDTRVNCTVADFDIENGIGRARTVVIDTDRATITGTGTVDLVQRRIDMRFTPHTKGAAVLSLATPMVVSGPFDSITMHPDAQGVVEKMGGLILSTVAAPAAILPFLHSSVKDNPCQKYLEKGNKP